MSFEARERGIKLQDLFKESFTHPNHFAMVREHEDRVKRYRELEEMMQLRKQTRLAMLRSLQGDGPKQFDEEKVSEQIVRDRRKKTVSKKYDFTEEQLQIAIRSLERHAGTRLT